MSNPSPKEIRPEANAPDGLALLIQDSVDNDPGFADVWAPFAVMSKLIDERLRLGLSQAEVATRMSVSRTAVAKLEADPSGVSFARILSYARAIEAVIEVKPTKQRPKKRTSRRGRPVTSQTSDPSRATVV